jgi:hypothetical protein
LNGSWPTPPPDDSPRLARPLFLLSPAHAGGRRAALLLNPGATFPLARQLQDGTAPLGELFSFVSGLYFRGKMAYVTRFGVPERVSVITPHRGLLYTTTQISAAQFREFGAVPIDPRDDRYRSALVASVRDLPAGPVVLLGSLATPKYLGILTELLPGRLYYPEVFLGIGDMSRGSIMLHAARTGEELTYRPVSALPSRLRA